MFQIHDTGIWTTFMVKYVFKHLIFKPTFCADVNNKFMYVKLRKSIYR